MPNSSIQRFVMQDVRTPSGCMKRQNTARGLDRRFSPPLLIRAPLCGASDPPGPSEPSRCACASERPLGPAVRRFGVSKAEGLRAAWLWSLGLRGSAALRPSPSSRNPTVRSVKAQRHNAAGVSKQLDFLERHFRTTSSCSNGHPPRNRCASHQRQRRKTSARFTPLLAQDLV